jgi:hypothetical protein
MAKISLGAAILLSTNCKVEDYIVNNHYCKNITKGDSINQELKIYTNISYYFLERKNRTFIHNYREWGHGKSYMLALETHALLIMPNSCENRFDRGL